MPRLVYRYILGGSANESLLHTLKKGAPNPEFSGRAPASKEAFSTITERVRARVREVLIAWKRMPDFRDPTEPGVQLAPPAREAALAADFLTFSSHALADLEDKLAASLDLKQYHAVLTLVHNGFPYSKLSKAAQRLFAARRRDYSLLFSAYYLDVMATAVDDRSEFTLLLRRCCPDVGVPCGWVPHPSVMYLTRGPAKKS